MTHGAADEKSHVHSLGRCQNGNVRSWSQNVGSWSGGGKAHLALPVIALLAISALSALLPAFALGFYALADAVNRDRQSEVDRLLATARSIVEMVDRELDVLREQATLFSSSRFLISGDLDTFEAVARDAAAMTGTQLVLLGRDYRQIINTSLPAGSTLGKTGHVDVVDKVLSSGQPYVTGLRRATTGGQFVMSIAVPVYRGDKADQVLVLTPGLGLFARVIERAALTDGWLAAIDDQDGTILARSTSPDRFVGTKARLVARGTTGTQSFIDLEGREAVITYAVSPVTGFRAVVWAPTSVFYARSGRLAVWLGVVGASAVVVALLAAFLTGRLIALPIGELAQAARKIAGGGVFTWKPTVMREANDAAAVMRRSAATVAEREAELRAESQKSAVLARELAHRIKNFMAIVSAIARQTGRTSHSLSQFIFNFDRRLSALAANIDLVIFSRDGGVDLNALLTSQLTAFGDGANIVVDGPAVLLSAEAAQTIGLAVHELATNALKYGALSIEPRGSVHISWKLDGDTFELRWAEKGGPAINEPGPRGFGRTVIERMVSDALGGEATLTFGAEGVVWLLRSPLCNVGHSATAAKGTSPA